MNEKYPYCESCFVVRVLDVAEIISDTEHTQDLGAHVFLSWNKEVCTTEEDFDEGDAVVEACVQQKKISFFEEMDELVDESMCNNLSSQCNEKTHNMWKFNLIDT
jgi:hypothetical protein